MSKNTESPRTEIDSMATLEHKQARPDLCYAFNESAEPGHFVVGIRRGESGYLKTTFEDRDPVKAKALVELMNHKLGVSAEEAQCMAVGAMFGWGVPGAQLKSVAKTALAPIPAVPKYPSPENLERIYAERRAQVQRLGEKPSISAGDIQALTRHGRIQVADELWATCDQDARQALLHDEHAHVRSTAEIASKRPPGVAVQDTNDKYGHTGIGARADQYDALEIHGVRDLNAGNIDAGTQFEVDYENPEMHSVYAHLKAGELECVGDMATHSAAVEYEMSRQYGLEVKDFSKCGDVAKQARASELEAQVIAGTKESFVAVNAVNDQVLSGKVMGITDLHLVLSLGRSAAILLQSDLSRVPAMGEHAEVVFKNGRGVVSDPKGKEVGR